MLQSSYLMMMVYPMECCNYICTFILAHTLVGIVIPGFSQATFEVDEDSNSLELCVDVSSASLERSVILSLFTVEATAQGRATAAC